MPLSAARGDFEDGPFDWRTVVASLAFAIIVNGDWEVLARAILVEVAVIVGIILIVKFRHRPTGPCTNDALPPT